MSALLVAPKPLAIVHEDSPMFVLTSLLAQLRDVITLLPSAVYRAQPAARVSGSVGEHVRHSLDHIAAFVAAMGAEEVSYDHRRRGTSVETDPATAVNEIERLLQRIERCRVVEVHRSVKFSALLHPDFASVEIRTTLARELLFVVQHTIHHCALIAVLLEWQGWRVPSGFGVAPSTARARAMVR